MNIVDLNTVSLRVRIGIFFAILRNTKSEGNPVPTKMWFAFDSESEDRWLIFQAPFNAGFILESYKDGTFIRSYTAAEATPEAEEALYEVFIS